MVLVPPRFQRAPEMGPQIPAGIVRNFKTIEISARFHAYRQVGGMSTLAEFLEEVPSNTRCPSDSITHVNLEDIHCGKSNHLEFASDGLPSRLFFKEFITGSNPTSVIVNL